MARDLNAACISSELVLPVCLMISSICGTMTGNNFPKAFDGRLASPEAHQIASIIVDVFVA